MKIKFWKAGCADAITISFNGTGGSVKNIFIDGGYLGTYARTIKNELLQIQSAKQNVDLWIITHTDRDHIGGVEAFIKDPTILKKEELVKRYWFNWSSYEFIPRDENISVAQGIKLRKYLADVGRLQQDDIVTSMQPTIWNGVKITILSPDEQRLTKSKVVWKDNELEKLIAAVRNDYNESIEALITQAYIEDNDVWNGGSIAFLMEKNAHKVMFLADSFPSVSIKTLKNMGYSLANRLRVDYIKLSHHASKGNFDPALLELIDCSKFIILANGITHSLPNKWTLSQILGSPFRSGEKISFFFNDDTESLKSIFAVDILKERFNFECIYNSLPFLMIELKD